MSVFHSPADMADELNALIAEDPELLATDSEPENPFADLDDLLESAVKAQAEKSAGERYRRALKAPGISPTEAAEITAKLREWEDRREWNSVAETALTIRTYCTTCRTWSSAFGGFFKHQTHRHNKTLERWLAIPRPQGGLPREKAFRMVEDKHCLGCLPLRGFGPEVPEVIWEGGVHHE